MFSCSISEGHPEAIDAESMTKELLDTNKCYLLDCGLEIYAWMGKNTSLDERKSASRASEVLLVLPFLKNINLHLLLLICRYIRQQLII